MRVVHRSAIHAAEFPRSVPLWHVPGSNPGAMARLPASLVPLGPARVDIEVVSEMYPLIAPNDPPPFTIINQNGHAKVLIAADHASHEFPHAMNRLGLEEWVLRHHIASDIGVKELVHQLSARLDAPAVLAGYSRLIVDYNRRLDDPSAFPEISDGVFIPGNQRLSATDKTRRAESFYHPYHDAIEERLAAFRSRGIVPVLIAVHSFTPEMDGMRRPWHVGILWDKDPRIPAPLIRNLHSIPGLVVGDNQPYSGRHPADFTIDHHGEAALLPHASIEVRQDLIDTQEGAARWAQRLADSLGDILADPVLYRLRQIQHDDHSLAGYHED